VRFVLQRANPAEFIPACSLAMAIDLRSVRSTLAAQARALQGVAATTALRTAHALAPYEWVDIESFLDGSPARMVAALECARTIEGRDNVRIARLLASDEPSIREAAGAALGPSPGGEAIAVVLELAESPQAEVASTAQRAFLQLDWEGAAGGWVGNLFARADADVRRLVLERIVRDGRPWLPPHELWRAAQEDGPMAFRTLAFQCLEACGGVDSKEMLAAQSQLPPLLRYHAARCAIADRSQEAAAILLDLVEARDSGEPTAEAARVEARILLASITGSHIHEEPSVWREWLRRNPNFDASGVRPLTPPR
jgi:hypothetical protein